MQSRIEPALLKVTDAAAFLAIGRTKLYGLLASGEIPVVRIGRSVRIDRGALLRWIREHSDEPADKVA